MPDTITVSLPDDLSAKVHAIAKNNNQSVEEVMVNYVRSFAEPLPNLAPDVQAELDALQYLSDDILWTIAQKQMSSKAQSHARDLMTKNNHEPLTQTEQSELDQLVEQADHLMLLKAEAANILRQRGHTFTQQDFKPNNE